ncbi:hypothetical protein FQK07_13625 [Synechococcus sp. BSF8S]|uniref:hypothetical protein n=1 Tax=Synechococcales TaxID=1890424 RepID=UPI001626D25E|nr:MULTISPECIES: hypothetical protein [unclassified Synechococcus]MBC1262278.1 hypothetical protein [Synechococcus sp. BSF8S]MBC1263430.1 hypothetical protein [Synechococcus sp. BSA11S]
MTCEHPPNLVRLQSWSTRAPLQFDPCLGDGWDLFHPRNNMPPMTRMVIPCTRDAADAALPTSFSSSKLESFQLFTA